MLAPNTDPRKVPSVANLITILRDQSLWPQGFYWHFPSASHCAMGLMRRIGWVEHGKGERWCEVLNITPEQSSAAFSNGAYGVSDVTPEMVADRLEQLTGASA